MDREQREHIRALKDAYLGLLNELSAAKAVEDDVAIRRINGECCDTINAYVAAMREARL